MLITVEEGIYDGNNFDRAEEVSIAELPPGSQELMIYAHQVHGFTTAQETSTASGGNDICLEGQATG